MSRKGYKNMQPHIQNYEAKYKNSKTNLGLLTILTNIAFSTVRNSGLIKQIKFNPHSIPTEK